MSQIIHCIGDSHASFFSGRNSLQPVWPEKSSDTIPFLKSYRLGAVLAYSLSDLGTTMLGREKLLEIVKTLPHGSNLLFAFGEIDCRVHLIKQSEKQNKTIEDVVISTTERYISALVPLKNEFHIIIWGVPPSTTAKDATNQSFPHYGTCEERNAVTKIFNKNLEILSKKHGFTYISIFDTLIHKNGLTNNKYFIDDVHLSQRTMPLAVKTIHRALPDLSIKLFFGLFSTFPFEVQLALFTWKSCIKTFFFTFFILLKRITRKPLLAILGNGLWHKIRNYKLIKTFTEPLKEFNK